MKEGTKITTEQAKEMLRTRGDKMTSSQKAFMKVIANPTGKRMDASMPSMDIPAAKAKQILKEGQIGGKPLTEKQKGLFGAAAGK